MLALGALLSATAPAHAAWASRSIAAAEPLRQIRAGGPSGLLAVGAGGALWALSASGHGRIAARQADGGLWVWQGGQVQRGARDVLAPQAGLLVLPLAVVGVAAGSHRVLRFEPDAGQAWAVVPRSAEAVLPDARPLQVDLEARGDGGHLVLLAGPDSQRYAHGVLGDGVEATRVLWLERHSLALLRELVLPRSTLVWLAMLGYLAYTYTGAAFAYGFNVLFPLYVALFALCGTTLIAALSALDVTAMQQAFDAHAPRCA